MSYGSIVYRSLVGRRIERTRHAAFVRCDADRSVIGQGSGSSYVLSVSASPAREVQLPVAFRGMSSRRPVASVAKVVSSVIRTRSTPGLCAAAHRVYPFGSLFLEVRKATEQLGGPGDKQYGITDSGVWSRRRTVSTGKSAHQYIPCQSEDVSDVAPSSVAASVRVGKRHSAATRSGCLDCANMETRL